MAKVQLTSMENTNNSIELGEEKQLVSSQPELLNVAVDTEERVDKEDLYYEPVSVTSDNGLFPLTDEQQAYINREYLIYDQNMEADGNEYEVSPMSYFLSETSGRMVNDILRKFCFFRSDIRVRIQLVSPAIQYGFVTGYAEPIGADEETYSFMFSAADYLSRWNVWSQLTSFTLSVEEQESLEFVLPWPYPGTMAPLHDLSTSISLFAEELWKLHLQASQVYQITEGSGNPEINILVYAKLENVVLTGPSYRPASDFAMQQGPQPVVELQMKGSQQGMEFATQTLGTAFRMASAVSTAWGIYSNLTEGGDSGTANVEDSRTSEVSQTRQVPVNERGAVRQSVYGNTTDMATMDSYQNLGDVPNIGIVNSGYIGMSGDIALDWFALSRRWQVIETGTMQTDDRIVKYACPQYVQDFTFATGDDNYFGPKTYGYLALSMRNYRLWRGSMEYELEFFGSPLLVSKILITLYWTRSSYSASGTQEFLPSRAEVTEAAGDVYSTTYTVKGHQQVRFTVPYVKSTPWSRTDYLDVATPVFDVRVLNILPSSSGGEDVIMPYILKYRAGADFAWRGYTGGAYPESPYVEPSLEKNKATRGGKQKVVNLQGLINSEQDVTTSAEIAKFQRLSNPVSGEAAPTEWYSLLRRPGMEENQLPATPGNFTGLQGGTATTRSKAMNQARPIDRMAACFLWWRGSLQCKMAFTSNLDTNKGLHVGLSVPGRQQTSTGIDIDSDLKLEYGAMVTEPGIWPIIEIEKPYIGRFFASRTMLLHKNGVLRPFYQIHFSEPPVSIIRTLDEDNSPVPRVSIVAPGQDFAFYGLLPAPNIYEYQTVKLFGITSLEVT